MVTYHQATRRVGSPQRSCVSAHRRISDNDGCRLCPRTWFDGTKVVVATGQGGCRSTGILCAGHAREPVIGHDVGRVANNAHPFSADVRNRNPGEVDLRQAGLRDSVNFKHLFRGCRERAAGQKIRHCARIVLQAFCQGKEIGGVHQGQRIGPLHFSGGMHAIILKCEPRCMKFFDKRFANADNEREEDLDDSYGSIQATTKAPEAVYPSLGRTL